MKIALVQFNPTVGAFDDNAARMARLCREAAGRRCDLAVFPELAVCGYPPRDLLERPGFVEGARRALDALVAEVRGIGVLCGTVERNEAGRGRALQNVAVLFEDGRRLARYAKRLLPTYDVFDEARYFEPGTGGEPAVFRGTALGITICEDIWNDPELSTRHSYPVDPVAELAAAGAEVFVTLSASPYDTEKPAFRREILRHLARKYRRPFLYVNQVGGQDCLVFDGGSLAVDAEGRLTARAADFEEDLVVVDTGSGRGDLHPVSEGREEEVIRALALALRDYTARCGFRSVVLGLSGGIDSAVTAAVAARALGPENVVGLLMPSPYTSEASLEDAAALARNLGIRTETLPITGVFEAYRETLAPFFGGRGADLVEQNLQARIRGGLLMAVSNQFGHMVLSTGNKSEMAVGYCTLYGDLSGGFALISDVPKGLVYDLARHINRDREVIPRRILERPPSAELRPDQRDQDDLPPYDVVDRVIRGYVEENRSPGDLAREGIPPAVVGDLVRRIHRSEYKRWQAPPGPRITTRALRCGRRYPIAHGFRDWETA
ncbi:NAD+ synthase [Dissulfurirhabdus thermomarina]|uniref:Glutamine-dependent NAD(+) synthetase n=1 Tax=Dissulfurirhabdus thermomarina TaxID=1765737 RepID=A0A6N9TNC8_DISTH|nr:NAD+ synthase [Dissulfurirhabdus thermomarina]NDY42548.1 NAD+ synthase [Dissulfurirhabdus thermomarina]NMX23693.1 NAD+ synthase [Dissulfurirhabdus thermomarina]